MNNLDSSSIKIQDSIKLNFLRKALLDSNAIIESRKTLITHYNIIPNLDYYIPVADSFQTGTRIDYLSYYLEEPDTTFIRTQLIEDIDFDIKKLSDHNFEVFDLKTFMEKGITYDSILKLAESRNKKNHIEGNSFIMIKGPIFNKKLDRVYLEIDTYHYGKEFIFIKEDDNWSKIKIGSWVE